MDKSQRGTIFLLIAGAVLLIAAAVLILIPRQNTETPEVADVADEVAPLVEAGRPFPEVERISITDTKALFDAQSAVIVDVRSAENYAESHIPDALSIPTDEIEARSQELPLDKEILLYCTWPSEESSARAASILMDLGFTNVKAILGGYRAWIDAGYPIVEG